MRIFILILTLASIPCALADSPVYRLQGSFTGLYINTSKDETLNPLCESPDNVGKSNLAGQCSGKIIVDNESLRQLVEAGGDYSDETIYTGQVTNMDELFYNRDVIHPISGWDTSRVTSMRKMFNRSKSFNQDISNWNTSSLTDAYYMFNEANSFNQDIGSWDVSKVENMFAMFNYAFDFNQDISTWDVGNVTNMGLMFRHALSFNQGIGNWDTSKVTNMHSMFVEAAVFSGDLSNWCVSNITNEPDNFAINSGLANAYYPKWGLCPIQSIAVTDDCLDPQNIEKIGIAGVCKGKVIASNSLLKSWVNNEVDYSDAKVYTGQVTNMDELFYNRNVIHPISGWDTSRVTSMRKMFNRSKSFNQDISNWDTSSLTDAYYMFNEANSFNQDIGSWDVSKVENMFAMFNYAFDFNQDISTWDVGNVTNMGLMFRHALSFNQDLKKWCVINFSTQPSNFSVSSALADVNHPIWGTCP